MKDFGIKKIYNFDGSWKYQVPKDYHERVRTNVQDSKKLTTLRSGCYPGA